MSADEYRFESSDSAPGMPTIVDATGRSILASIDGTPVFAYLAVATRVLALLNTNASEDVWAVAADRDAWEQRFAAALYGTEAALVRAEYAEEELAHLRARIAALADELETAELADLSEHGCAP